MSGYNELKNAIRRVVKTNNNREITGQNLQSTLTSMVNSLGANYHFAGFASPDTNPGTPDQNIFYIASEEGTYVNFDGINLEPGLSFLMWNGKWSSETISVGEVTKSWVQQNYVSIAFFNELFELYNDSTKIAVNDTVPVDKTKLNIKAMFGFWTEQYISALGKNDSGGSGSGVDMATVWSALAGSTDEQINESHLTTALSEYATMSWVSQIFATITSIPTKLSQLANDTGFITSAALPTKLSQFTNDTDFITSAALPTKVSQLANDAGYVTASIVNGYATQLWVSQNYVSIEFFERLFQAYSGTTKVDTNSTSAIDNIKAMFGFWTEQYISALGKNDSGGSGSGVDMATVWSALAGSTDEQINESHLTTALSEYATMSWVSQIFATITSIPTKLSQLANDTGFITSAALPTKISQLTNDTGFITSAALPTKLSQLANDTGFITSAALPTKVSQLVNDAGYVTASIVNGYATQSWVSQNYALKSDIPTKLSQLANDTGFITSAALPTKISQLVNDAGYVTASIVNGYATQSWVSQNYVSVEFFERIFQAYSGTTKVDTNSASAIDNIKAMFGFWTEQYISALGNSDTTGGGGLMGSIVPYAKAITLTTQNEGEEIASAWSVKMLYDKIENVDVSGQLTSYLTKQEAQTLYQPVGNYLTGITKEQVEGVLTGNITSHTHSQYLTSHQDISGKADRSELSQYLPLTGGTMTGKLQITPKLEIQSGADGKIVLNNTDNETNWNFISFQQNGVTYGELGTAGNTNLIWNFNILWHTGNLTKVSQLTNDTGFITSAALPTKVSQLTNDAGYVTASIVNGYATQSWVSNNYLPLSGGTLTNNSKDDVLNMASNNTTVWMGWKPSDSTFRYLGVDTSNNLKFRYNSVSYNVIHSGNIGSQSVNYANTSGRATNANQLIIDDGTYYPQVKVESGHLAPIFRYNYTNYDIIHSGNIGLQSVNYASSSGACSGNAASATKIQTSRTIWGQVFDGTSNVDGNLSCNGQGSFNSLQIGNITIIYDASNKGLRIAGGGLYTDSYLSSLGVDASTALSVKKWADSINLTEESDSELATAYSIGNLYRFINSNQESITQSLNQSVGALQGRCTSLEQRVSALENKVNK